MQDLKARFGPQVLGVFSGSIGVENLEMAGLVQRFKAAFGLPNFFSVESVCYRMRIRVRQMTFGRYPVEEMDSNLYILWGHNPERSDFPLKLALERNLKKGAKLVIIDPKRIAAADRADMVLRIRPGTDGALALALMHVIVKEELYDKAFIEQHTFGFDRLIPHVQPYTPEWVEAITWVPAEETRKLARLFAGTKGASIFQGTCTHDQTANGTQNSRAFSVLQAITGNINVPGGWVTAPAPRFGNIALNVEGDPVGSDQYPLFFEMWGRKSPYGVVTVVPERIPHKLKAFCMLKRSMKVRKGFSIPLRAGSKFTVRPWKKPALILCRPFSNPKEARNGPTKRSSKDTPSSSPQETSTCITPTANTGGVKALKKAYPEPLAKIGPKTAEEFELKSGEMTVIETTRGRVKMKVKVDERVAEGVVLVPHGWGGEANANLLTDVHCREPIMGYPDMKSLQCRIRKA